MTLKIKLFVTALTLSAISLPSVLSAEVHFKSVSFADAKKMAAKEHKKILVDYYTDWCSWCKVLDKKTYTDAAVGKLADASFISVKIDAEKGEGVELAKANQVTGYPTIVFYSAEGKEIERVVGYQDADRFARSLRMAAAGGTKSLLAEVEKNKNLKDAGKWLIAADFYAEHQQTAKALAAFENVMRNDPENKLKLREEAKYGVAFLTDGDKQWDLLEQAMNEFPTRDEARQAVMLLMKHQFDTDHPDMALQEVERYAMHHPDDVNAFNYFAWTAAEKGVQLEKAMEYSDRTIALASDPTERASMLDTKAEILFKMGQANQAAALENEALQMIQESKNGKLYKDLTAQKDKFEKAAAAGTVTPDVATPQVTRN